MADDIDEAADDRAVELASLAAIYPELVRDSANPFSASIDIPVEPIKPFAILFPNVPIEEPCSAMRNQTSSGCCTSSWERNHQSKPTWCCKSLPTQDLHNLSYLPPLILRMTLPDGYPSQEPPFFSLSSGISWIPAWRLQQLKDAGHKLWEDMGKDQVVFTYIDSLREAAENGFDLTNQADEHVRVSQDLKLALLDFDSKAKRAKFEHETFNCSICLEPKKGGKCHKLSHCGHVFCVACLQDFFNSCITEGDVNNVKCIAPHCGEHPPGSKDREEDRTLDPSELLQIPLSQDQVRRYITLKRKKRYDADPTTVYCPRTWCQGPARTKASETAEALRSEDEQQQSAETKSTVLEERVTDYVAPADRLAICQDCNFAFCQVCKASWHGEFVWCSTRNKGELSVEEKASEDYLKLHSTPCPTCNAPCQKSMGCNHMTCPTCKSHFCYLCSSWLDKDNPYKHFNDDKNPCYMRLWELEGGDGGR